MHWLFLGMLSFSFRWSTRVDLKLPTSWFAPFWWTLLSLDGMDERGKMAVVSEQIPLSLVTHLSRFRTFEFLYGPSLFNATKTPALRGHWKNFLPKAHPSFCPCLLCSWFGKNINISLEPLSYKDFTVHKFVWQILLRSYTNTEHEYFKI